MLGFVKTSYQKLIGLFLPSNIKNVQKRFMSLKQVNGQKAEEKPNHMACRRVKDKDLPE